MNVDTKNKQILMGTKVYKNNLNIKQIKYGKYNFDSTNLVQFLKKYVKPFFNIFLAFSGNTRTHEHYGTCLNLVYKFRRVRV